MGDILWDRLSQRKRAELIGKVQRLARKFSRINYTEPAHTSLSMKIRFSFCRMMQKSLHEADPEYLDGRYWAQQGWLGGARPWKT